MDMNARNEKDNRQMQLMLDPAVERLQKYSIEELCQKGSIQFDEASKEFIVPSLGQEIRIHYPDYALNYELDMWHHLTILQYMDTADGSALSGNWIGLAQMRGGLSRGKSFDQEISNMVEKHLVDVDAEAVEQACLRLGGTLLKGKADVSATIPYAPMFVVQFNFWEGDDEFAPSAKVLVDERSEHYLTLEAAGTACSSIVQRIISELTND